MVACKFKLEKVAIKMIDRWDLQSTPDFVDSNGSTALNEACLNGLNQTANYLMYKFGSRCLPQRKLSYMVLASAYNNCSEEVILRLIDLLGSDYDLPTFDGKYTMLMYACEQKKELIAVKLLEKFGTNCKINKVDTDDMTAWEYAKKHKLTLVMDQIRKLSLTN